MALRQLLPSAELYGYELSEVKRANRLESVADSLSDSDIVLTQQAPSDFGPLSTEILKKSLPKLHPLPMLTFTGFHPDCIYIVEGGKTYGSSMGPYNSAIAAACFSLGMTASETLSFYRSDIYECLNYFEEFEKARRYIDSEFKRCGLSSDDIFSDMEERVFMHTTNHPKGVFVSNVAKWIAVKIGLIPTTAKAPDLALDVLTLYPVWPVYPEIAARRGGEGSLLFKKSGSPDGASGTGVFLDLEAFVNSSFSAYTEFDPIVFSVPNVARIAEKLEGL